MFLLIFLTKTTLCAIDIHSNVFSDDYKTLITVGRNQETFNVPSSITLIGESAFKDNRDVVHVLFTADSQLEEIGPYSFKMCKKITDLDLSVCKNLKHIRKEALMDCSELVNLKIPKTIVTLENQCFRYISITEFTVTKSVTTIEYGVFYDCSFLKSLIFEDGSQIKSIPGSFALGTSLEFVSLPSTLESIHYNAFYKSGSLKEIQIKNCASFVLVDKILCTHDKHNTVICPSNITNDVLTVPNTITKINLYSFSFCQAKEIIVGESVTVIETSAFDHSMIQKITINDSVKTISSASFYGCKELVDVKLSNSLVSLSGSLFAYCEKLETIVIPESVSELLDDCFIECKKLKNIAFSQNITSIGQTCFKGCIALENVVLPSNLTKFGGGAFSGCNSINLSFSEGSKFYIDEQFLITSDNITILCQFIGSEEGMAIKIPDTIIVIDSSAFALNTCFVSIEFGQDSQLTTIKKDAFCKCRNLTSIINLPKTLGTIGSYAFASCPLPNITFGENITSIEAAAFTSTPIETVIFPDESKGLSIDGYAFYECKSLRYVKLPENIEFLGYLCFGTTPNLKEIILPATTKRIATYIFGYSGITKVTFSNTSFLLNNITQFAFAKMYHLTDFEFREGITDLGNNSFSYTGLTNVTLPSTLKTIGYKCFQSCSNLITINVGNSDSQLQTIGDGIFVGCLKLKLIECTAENFTIIRGGLYNIAKTEIYAFPPASSIHYVVLPTELVYIKPSTFYSCKNIFIIQLPDDSKLETIGINAFENCNSLKFINIPSCTTVVGVEAFKGCESLSCGLIINNDSKEFRDSLVKYSKMPLRCLNSCFGKRTKQDCRNSEHKIFLFIGTTLLLNSE